MLTKNTNNEIIYLQNSCKSNTPLFSFKFLRIIFNSNHNQKEIWPQVDIKVFEFTIHNKN